MTSDYSLLYSIVYTVQYSVQCIIQYTIGVWEPPSIQWNVNTQLEKTKPKFHDQKKHYVRHKLVAYFSTLAKLQNLSVGKI